MNACCSFTAPGWDSTPKLCSNATFCSLAAPRSLRWRWARRRAGSQERTSSPPFCSHTGWFSAALETCGSGCCGRATCWCRSRGCGDHQCRPRVYVNLSMYLSMHLSMYLPVSMYLCVCICVYVRVCIHIHVYIDIYMKAEFLHTGFSILILIHSIVYNITIDVLSTKRSLDA